MLRKIIHDTTDLNTDSNSCLFCLNSEVSELWQNTWRYWHIEIKTSKYLSWKKQGEIIRSQTKYYEEGEKNQDFILNLEKRQSSNKTIHRLQLSDHTRSTQNTFWTIQRLFYKGLYTKTRHLHCSEFIADLQIPKIPENIKEDLESDI